jgi:predicted acylesterase/phospholipase RssA
MDAVPPDLLSGGGYRAALFHAGVMRALQVSGNLTDLGAHQENIAIAAVSGGSITALL